MRKNNSMKNMTIAAILGGMGVAGCVYLKRNPEAMNNMKNMVKNAAKMTYEKLDGQKHD